MSATLVSKPLVERGPVDVDTATNLYEGFPSAVLVGMEYPPAEHRLSQELGFLGQLLDRKMQGSL